MERICPGKVSIWRVVLTLGTRTVIQYNSFLKFYMDDLYNFIYLFYSPLSASLNISTGMSHSKRSSVL